MSKKITNTTREANSNPLPYIAWLGGGNPQAIEAQEAQGQQEAVNSSQLPTKGLVGAERKMWESMGIKIFDNEPTDDSLFVRVELPEGWKRRPTDHSMWNELVDNKGRVRGKFFYKAAFYDRDAFLRPQPRFTLERDYNRDTYKSVLLYQVKDGGQVVFEKSDKLEPTDGSDRSAYTRNDAIEKKVIKECRKWLSDNGYENWEDPSAYWD